MQDILTRGKNLKRPKILVRAARFGLMRYARESHLRRCLGQDFTPSPGRALIQLFEIEKQLNSERKTKDGAYEAAKHVDVLTAIMGETQNLQASATQQNKARRRPKDQTQVT